eukprot:UN20579
MEDLQTGKVVNNALPFRKSEKLIFFGHEAISTKIATELQKLDKDIQKTALQGLTLRIKKIYGMEVVVKFDKKSGKYSEVFFCGEKQAKNE